MNSSRSNTNSTAQKGFTLIELMIAAVILATTVAITINVFGINMKQSSQARNQLKASELARAKLDDYKDYARRASINGGFTSITQSSFAIAYDLSNTTTVNDLKLTWRVERAYCYQNGLVVSDVTTNTVTSKMLRLLATVNWYEGWDPKKITMTTYVSDITQ
jgi:prepilin-type N-terminal cleavage/methylation domain-containing protein